MSTRVLLTTGLVLFVATGTARADAVKIQYFTRVAEGQKPRVVLQATEPVSRILIELSREDGQTFSGSWGTVAAGEKHELVLGGEAGTRTYSGRIVVSIGGAERESPLSLSAVVAATLKVECDKSKVDLVARRLELRLSRPAGKVELKIHTGTGEPATTVERDFSGHAAGDTLVVTWPPVEGDVARIDIKATDADGFFTGLSLLPWSVRIPHEEVNFATDKSDIGASERPKLEASLVQINAALASHRELGAIKLFIAGHTDSVGDAAYNLKLSMDRARAIAGWFRTRKLRIPIAFEGFGESAPAVPTADNTDEPRNRRVDYILAIEEPALKTVGFKAAWKYVK